MSTLFRWFTIEFQSKPAFAFFMLAGLALMALISLGMLWGKHQKKVHPRAYSNRKCYFCNTFTATPGLLSCEKCRGSKPGPKFL